MTNIEIVKATVTQNIFRVLLGLFMIIAAIGHFTIQRQEFQAQVPDWVPVDKDVVVILSGIFEATIGLAMIFLTKHKVKVGIALSIFYVLIYPGNIAQYLNHTKCVRP